MRSLILCCGMVGLASLTGCNSTDSENVKTAGISANMEVVAYGDGKTVVTTYFNVGIEPIVLSGQDQVIARANNQSLMLVPVDNNIINQNWYQAVFDFDDVGTEFIVSFNRAEDVNAPDSRAEIPELIDYILPVDNQVFTKDSNISITWGPSGISDKIYLGYKAECPLSNGLTGFNFISNFVPDSGAYTIPLTSVIADADEKMLTGNSCKVTITMERSKEGTLDKNFEKNNITGYQRRIKTVFVTK